MTILRTGLCALALLATGVPAHAAEPSAIRIGVLDVAAGSPAALRVEGVVTADAGDCPLLLGSDGTVYALATRGDTWVAPGDNLVVTGVLADLGFCRQANTIAVAAVEPVPAAIAERHPAAGVTLAGLETAPAR